MKKCLFPLILALISMAAGAQTVGEVFYIYQNNGNFNAFMKSEVDSITYSNIGLDSVECNDIVTQLVYTKDSVYKISLSNIDSVAFVTPQTIVNKDVFPLTSAHDPYIIKGDTISFSMLLTTPDNMRPQKGNIVVSEYDCTSFANGIIARVTSVNETGSAYEYNCEKATLDDVYDQIVAYNDGTVEQEQDTTSAAKDMKRVQGSLTKILWDKTFDKSIEYSGTTTKLKVNDKAYIKVTMRKTLTTPLYACFEVQNTLSSNIDFNAKTETGCYQRAEIVPTLTLGRIFVPEFPLIWIQPQLGMSGFFREEGSVELNYAGHFNRTDKAVLTYNGGNWSFNYLPSTNAGTDVANISMKGYAEVGLTPDLFFSLCGTGTGFGMRASAGLKESIDFLFDATKLKDGGMYEANKTSYCRTTIPYSVEVYANAHLFNNHSEVAANASITYSKEPQWGTDKYILPLFSTLAYERGVSSDKGGISTTVSRDLIVPAKVGMRLYDSNGSLLDDLSVSSTSNSYKNEKYTTQFTGLQENKEYTVYPTVTIFGYTMEATPTLKFKVKESPDDAIDLGLSVKWASHNIGAATPEGYGNYYAWGETATKSDYSPSTSKWYGISYSSLQSQGVIDSNGNLTATYDAATQNWGGRWRMPTKSEMDELDTKCTWTWTTYNGVNGIKVVGPNGNSIFLPAAGYRYDSDLNGAGSYGGFWSSTAYDYHNSYYLYFNSGNYYNYGLENYYRSGGVTVRPVSK